MIHILRRRFIAIAMSAMILVLTVIIGVINYSNYRHIVEGADALLSAIADNQGTFPKFEEMEPPPNDGFGTSPPQRETKEKPREKKEFSPEASFTTRYFTVELTQSGDVLAIDTGKIAAISTEEAKAMATDLSEQQKVNGFYGNYKYRTVATDNGILYIFLDCSDDLATMRSFLWISLAVSAGGILLVFLLVLFFSRLAMRPVAESYEKQKQFITDAGHELKTPLTIIDANTEVLEMMNGENEWTNSIRNQVNRLSDFTHKLIVLSRMEEDRPRLMMTDFSLSDAVSETAEAFTAVAQSQEKELTLSVENALTYHGDESSVRQVVSLLLDNAIKYSSPKSAIHLTLKSTGKRKVLTVENRVDTYPAENPERWFERFYRSDVSRNSASGGHGIGLSTAKAIVTAHKGKINARCVEGNIIQITITL